MGIEGSIHAISALYNEMSEQGHGLLLLDAANAFNAVNGKAALLNSQKEWPRASTFLFNEYQRPAELFFQVAQEPLYSNEGTTQGDPLSVLFYGMALMTLIRKVRDSSKYSQSFYADDDAACGDLKELAL